jgi:hypothetical protein
MTTQFEIWLETVNTKRKKGWDDRFSNNPYTPLKVERGSKYIKLIDRACVWGFVSMVDGVNQGVPVKKGDLLKPASWKAPAKHSRGNIFDGTDKWTYYGPDYL